jgi:hypothetical protein
LVDKTKIHPKKQEIQSLFTEESEVVDEIVNVQKIIEDTAKDIERQNER